MLATTIQHSNTTPHHQSEATTRHRLTKTHGPVVSGPNSVSDDFFADKTPAGTFVAHPPTPTTGADALTVPTAKPLTGVRHGGKTVLLRKEVIQPHLPVRLPCYDFVPIADPTFDSSPHKG